MHCQQKRSCPRAKMMRTQLNLEDEVREFVGDFNKFFEKLKEWTDDSIQIDTLREFFEKKYPKMFDDSFENEVKMDVDVDTTMETESRPIVDREQTGIASQYKSGRSGLRHCMWVIRKR